MLIWLQATWNSGLPMTLFTSVVVPVGAVFLSVYVTNKIAKQKALQDEKNQRIKLLNMLENELETVIRHYNETGKYYLRETITGHLIVNSPCFNLSDHQALLNKLWEYMRGYQSLNTAINSIPIQTSQIQTAILTASKVPVPFLNLFNIEKHKVLTEELDNHINDIIDRSTGYIIEAAIPLLGEVERLTTVES